MGRQRSRAISAARRAARGPSRSSSASASVTRSGVGATAASATRCRGGAPPLEHATEDADRGQVHPLAPREALVAPRHPAVACGNTTSVTSSPGMRQVWPGPRKSS